MEESAIGSGKSPPHLLHIAGSPRGAVSASQDISERFIEAWTAEDPARTVGRLDIWEMDLPSFDGAALEAKYASLAGTEMTGEPARVWATIR